LRSRWKDFQGTERRLIAVVNPVAARLIQDAVVVRLLVCVPHTCVWLFVDEVIESFVVA